MPDLDIELPLLVTADDLLHGAERSFTWNDGHSERTLRLRVPVGAQPGTRLRFSGQGRFGDNGEAGDLYLRLVLQSESSRRATGGMAQSRIAGMLLLAVGIFLVALTEYTARTEGTYRVPSTFLGPVAVIIGIGLFIHAPKAPIPRTAWRENAYILVGVILGVLNLYRFGAFDADSKARVPVLVGLATVALYSLYDWIRIARHRRRAAEQADEAVKTR